MGIDPIEWTTADAEKFLGVQNLSAESASALGRMLSGVSALLQPLDVSGTLNADLEVETNEDIAEKVQNILSAQDLTAEITGQINADWQVSEVGDPGEEILALVSPDGQYAIPVSVLAEVGGDQFIPSLIPPISTQRVPVSAEAAVQWKNTVTIPEIPAITDPVTMTTPVNSTAIVENSLGVNEADLTAQIPTVTDPVTVDVPVNPNPVLTDLTEGGFDASVITAAVPNAVEVVSVSVPIAATYTTNQFLGRALEDFGIQAIYEFPTAVTVMPAYDVRPKFAGTNNNLGIKNLYTAHTTVSVQVHYSTIKDPMPNFTSGIRQARGGLIRKNGVMGFATGGMVRGGAQLVTVAEEGTPEMIIPLGSQRRQRGLDLWEKAGHMLGVPGFAKGGLVGRTDHSDAPWKTPLSERRSAQRFVPWMVPEKPFETPSHNDGETVISVNVGGITIQLNTGDASNNVVAAIETHKDEIADSIGEALKQALQDAFVNMPAQGGKTA